MGEKDATPRHFRSRLIPRVAKLVLRTLHPYVLQALDAALRQRLAAPFRQLSRFYAPPRMPEFSPLNFATLSIFADFCYSAGAPAGESGKTGRANPAGFLCAS